MRCAKSIGFCLFKRKISNFYGFCFCSPCSLALFFIFFNLWTRGCSLQGKKHVKFQKRAVRCGNFLWVLFVLTENIKVVRFLLLFLLSCLFLIDFSNKRLLLCFIFEDFFFWWLGLIYASSFVFRFRHLPVFSTMNMMS